MHPFQASPLGPILFSALLAGCGDLASPTDDVSAHLSVESWDVYYHEASGEVEGSVTLSVENTGSIPIYLNMYGSARWQQLQSGDEWVTVYTRPLSVLVRKLMPIEPGARHSKNVGIDVRPGDPDGALNWQSPVPGDYRLLVTVLREDSEGDFRLLGDSPLATEPMQLEAR